MKGHRYTEAELCGRFAEAARVDGWDVYPEVAGWDLLLVWSGRVEAPVARGSATVWAWAPRYQIGVDAKLRANCEVLGQAAHRMELGRRPDHGAVLVPEATGAFPGVARRLGLGVFDREHFEAPDPSAPEWRRRIRATIRPDTLGRVRVHELKGRLPLPPVPLQGDGGEASPRTMSPWRVDALRVVRALRAAGSLTRAEAKAVGPKIDLSDWAQRGWVVSDGNRPARYVEAPGLVERSGGPLGGYLGEYEALCAADGHPVPAAPPRRSLEEQRASPHRYEPLPGTPQGGLFEGTGAA